MASKSSKDFSKLSCDSLSNEESLSNEIQVVDDSLTNATTSSDDPLCLECKVCDKTFQPKNGPLILPCLHSFCKPCLEKSIEKEEREMACPTCGQRFPQPIKNLPVNLRLSHLAKSSAIEKQAGEGNVKCQKCEGTPKLATSFSCTRSKFLCDKCKRDFQRFIDDDEELECIELSAFAKGTFQINPPLPKCTKHKKETIALFCMDCKALICGLCSHTKVHEKHSKYSIDETAEGEKASLHELIKGVDDALATMDQTYEKIQSMREKVKASVEDASKRVSKACDDVIQAMENRKEVLKKKCQDIAEGKDDVLSNQMVEIERLRKNLGFAQLHAKDAINNQSPEEILSIKKFIEDRLNHTMKLYGRESMELQEDDIINTLLQIESLLQSINSMGTIPDVPDHSKCTVETHGNIATVGKEKKVHVTLKDETGSLLKSRCHVQYQLSKVNEDPDEYIPPKVTITQGGNGTAALTFTPDQIGEYELTIMVRNKPIADPYKFTVKECKDYKKFENAPVHSQKNLGGYSYGVAVHDNDTVYAALRVHWVAPILEEVDFLILEE